MTAVPTRRPMAQPTSTRARSWAGEANSTVTLSGPLRTRRPWRRTAPWDERPWRRLRPTAGAGPCGAGRRAPRDRLSSTCGDGTRGAWLACERSAGRCASLTPPRPEGRRAATAADAIPCPLVLDRCTSMRSMAERPSGHQVMTVGRAKRGSCAVQARGDRPRRQRAPGVLWTTAPFILIRGLARPTEASGSVPFPVWGESGDYGVRSGTMEHHGVCCFCYPQVWTGLWTSPSIRRLRRR